MNSPSPDPLDPSVARNQASNYLDQKKRNKTCAYEVHRNSRFHRVRAGDQI
ncbi:MAG: hypothetical protein KA713_17040 [Chryseotalea sp. WA131a]|nr:MAG: hypothetical protein KA713_17040 [Chryseotalea sp. WA131a]